MAIKPIEILIKAKDEASGIFGSLQSKVAGVGVAIAGYFGISAFVGAVKGAADLQAKLSEVEAVSGATAAEMVLLRKAAEEAGATTKFTATEGAQALGNLARAGLSAKDAIATLPAVLNLAQAGNIGLAEASEYVTKAVMGLGLEFADAGRVADVLAKGANASNTSVTGLAQALSYTAPIAKSVGLGLETTVAIIGKFADAGIDASRAGTALNAILSQFADPASKFRQELAGAGITTNNFEAALHQLAAAGPAGQKAILAVGTEAGPALRALLNQGMGALDELKGKLDNAAGSAAATAKVMQANLDGAMLSLGSTWESVRIALATPVLPALQSGVEKLTSALRSAVSDGTIGKFGEAIATAFQAGIKWAQEFFGAVDFAGLTVKMKEFSAQAKDTFTQLGESADKTGNIVKAAYGVMAGGINTVMTLVYKAAEAFAGVASNVQSVLATLMENISKVTFFGVSESFKIAAADMKLSAEATWAVSEAFAKKAEGSFKSATDAATIAREGFAGLAAGMQTASTQATASVKAWNDLSDAERLAANEAKLATINIKELTAAEQVSANEAKIAAFKKKEAADTVQAAIAELKKEYEAALATGNWQLAAEKILEIKKVSEGAKDVVTEQRKKAEEDAKLIGNAFADVGIKTKTELTNAANNAKTNFELIKSSGKATAEGLQTAFKNYAEKAIAANGGVATEALKSQAAMNGIEIQVDKTGKAIVQAMEKGKQATDGLQTSAKQAASSYQAVEDAAKSLLPIAKSEIQTKVDGAKASLDAATARYEDAKASGDEKAAAEALVEVKKAELEYAKALAEAKRAEAEAAKAVATAKHAEADAAINTARAIQAEIASSEEVTSAMRAMAAEANVTAVAKAGAAKQADAAAQAFDAEAKGLEAGVKTAERALNSATTALNSMRDAASGAGEAMRSMIWTEREYRDFKDRTDMVQALTQQLREGGNSARELAMGADYANGSVGYLAEQDLSALRSAISDADSRMKSLGATADSTLASISDELDALQGNFDEVETRAYELRRSKIENDLNSAKAEGNNDAANKLQQALSKLDTVYANYKLPEAKKKEDEFVKKAAEAAKAPKPSQPDLSTPSTPNATTYVSNITIPGIGTTQLTFADANSQRAGEDLLRKLAQAKGASI